MSSAELGPEELLQIMTRFLESQNVPYRVVGSMASIAYGEPRFTNDVDLLVDLTLDKVTAVSAAFPPPDFYVSEPAMREAIIRRRQFNILHLPSGLKVDIILPKDSDYARSEMSRGRRLTSPGEFTAVFGSPEDVILNKLIYFQLSKSEKHLRDIAGMLKLKKIEIDQNYIEFWGAKLGVLAEWQLVCERLRDASGHP